MAETASAGIIKFAQSLPDAASGHILECRLDGPAGAADYSVAVMQGNDGFQEFQDWITAIPRPGYALTDKLIEGMLRQAETVGVIWLEHDVAVNGSVSAPSFFVAPRQQPAENEVLIELVEEMMGCVADLSFIAPLLPVLQSLPKGTFLRQAGIMAGRTNTGTGGRLQALRLVIDGVMPSDIVPFLQSVQWPGNLEHAEELANLSQSNLRSGPCRIDLDLGQVLMPTLGIELPAGGLGSNSVLCDALITHGMATKEKSDVLHTLCKRQTLDRWTGPDGPACLDFGLNHLKLSAPLQTGSASTAKAYFSLVSTPDFTAALENHAQDGRR